MQSAKASSPTRGRAPGDQQPGIHVYCVADGGHEARLGPIGIDGCEVYSLPYRNICAVVHDCPAQPCRSIDPQATEGWVMAHLRVVDVA